METLKVECPLPTPSEKVDGGEETTNKPEKSGKRYLGLLLALIAAFLFSGVGVAVKMLNYDPFNLCVWRFFLMTLMTLPIVIIKGLQPISTGFLAEIWPPNKALAGLLFQSVLYCNGVVFLFYGLSYATMGDCTVILNSGPIFVTLIACIFLGEPCSIIPVICGLVAMIGVGVICKPPMITGGSIKTEDDWDMDIIKGMAYTFVSMIIFTVCIVITRNLRKVHYSLVQFTFCLWGFLQSALMAYLFQVIALPKDWWEVAVIAASSALGFGGQVTFTLALKWEQAGIAALVKTMEVPFSYFLQMIIFHHQPDIYSVVGAVLLQLCVIVAATRNTVMTLPEGHRMRKMFSFILL